MLGLSKPAAKTMSPADKLTAAVDTLCGQVLAGEISAAGIKRLPANLPGLVAARLNLTETDLQTRETLIDTLSRRIRNCQDPWMLGFLCHNWKGNTSEVPLAVLAALNRHSPWEAALDVLVKFPAEKDDEDSTSVVHDWAALGKLRGKYGAQTKYLAERILGAHEEFRAAMTKRLHKENPDLWSLLNTRV